MRIGLVVIGSELLLGKREDKHVPHLIGVLATHGLRLSWVRLVGDDAALLEQTFRETFASGDLVFSFGGIGATPDDLTRQCAAAAAGVSFARHPEAVALIEGRFGEAAYPNRILMADLPQGATLIPNPVNQIPGFSLGDHHFLPGFPNMAWPMAEWVLETRYRHLFRAQPDVERALTVEGAAESSLIPLMRELVTTFPDVTLSSLPDSADLGKIEIAVRGAPAATTPAFEWLCAKLTAMGIHWRQNT